MSGLQCARLTLINFQKKRQESGLASGSVVLVSGMIFHASCPIRMILFPYLTKKTLKPSFSNNSTYYLILLQDQNLSLSFPIVRCHLISRTKISRPAPVAIIARCPLSSSREDEDIKTCTCRYHCTLSVVKTCTYRYHCPLSVVI
jgi:hypothetical protein